ncbi:MAG: toll/interleukin-1 receptor domain-containing protein [Xanthomonadales bacterium]
MDERRYKAFISYSHRDERWARWLQRALERYRVPRRLVGQAAEHGTVPARLRPVFRDREDLSSASDLSGRIKQELAASETLIVVCSPAAAASRWVEEEIRYFRELGRAERILALVVDGDPVAQAGAGGCFPVALVESPDGERKEPLAADARRYADGKHLALLKIVAGILGVRLDELRRRDAQRRLRRRAVNTVVAASIAVVIAWLFHSAQSSREEVLAQRANTEEYLAFMLGNLDRLAPIPGLESVSPEDREPEHRRDQLGMQELANEELLERGRAWRENGLDLLAEADPEAAMKEFERSRAALMELYQRNRRSPDALYELGQTEYYVGEVHMTRGEIDKAQWHWYRYGVLTRRLVNIEPYNPRYVMELAYTLNNIGAVEQSKLMPDWALSLERLNQAIQFNMTALRLEPSNEEFQHQLTTMLEWKADAHWGLCELGDALEVRTQTVARRREHVARDPDDAVQRKELAFTLSGLAGVQSVIGLTGAAVESGREAVEILQSLSEASPDDVRLAWEALYREIRLARDIGWQGDRALASLIIERNEPKLEELASIGAGAYEFIAIEAASFDVDYARVLFRRNETGLGEERLRRAVARLSQRVTESPDYRPSLEALIAVYFEYWRHFGASPGTDFDRLVDRFPVTPETVQSCTDADLAARLAVVQGDRERAGEYVNYALEKGYYAPEFIAFCSQYGLCETR